MVVKTGSPSRLDAYNSVRGGLKGRKRSITTIFIYKWQSKGE